MEEVRLEEEDTKIGYEMETTPSDVEVVPALACFRSVKVVILRKDDARRQLKVRAQYLFIDGGIYRTSEAAPSITQARTVFEI